MANDFVTLDTGTPLTVVCRNNSDGSVIDLTGSSLMLRYSYNGGENVERSMTITSAADGEAKYTWIQGELKAGGKVKFEVTITNVSGLTMTCLDYVEAIVRPRIGLT